VATAARSDVASRHAVIIIIIQLAASVVSSLITPTQQLAINRLHAAINRSEIVVDYELYYTSSFLWASKPNIGSIILPYE